MDAFIAEIRTYGTFALSGITAMLWYLVLFRSMHRSAAGIIFFPIAHSGSVVNVRDNTETIPIVLCYLMFIIGLGSLLSSADPNVYISGWGLLLLYQLIAISAYFLNPRHRVILSIISLIFLLLVIYFAVKTVRTEVFQIMNNLDFVTQVYVIIGSIIAIVSIIRNDRFAKEPETLFVFFGLIIYSFLQCLSTIMLAFDFIQNFDFAYYATLITLLFWLASIPWIKRLKSRLT